MRHRIGIAEYEDCRVYYQFHNASHAVEVIEDVEYNTKFFIRYSSAADSLSV